MKPVVELKNATKIIDNGMNEKKVILDHVNLAIYPCGLHYCFRWKWRR